MDAGVEATTAFPASHEIFRRCRDRVPAGVSSNTRARVPHPLYFARAEGCFLYDVDDNRYYDILMGNGAILLGHNNPEVQDAVRGAIDSGLTTGVEAAASCDLAERFLAINTAMDMVRFTNTGTEAVLHALRLARFATGRQRIAKTEGSYHGWSDEVFISAWPNLKDAGPPEDIRPLPGTPGQRADLVAEAVILPFNDIERSIAAIERNANTLAAVILEPILIDVGFIPAQPAYLKALRDVCTKNGIVLIFDELLTGFNVAPGGAQQLQGVIPDLAVYGKGLGNGYPIAAVAGRENLMRMLEPGSGPVFVGTFNGHAVCVAAALASLRLLEGGAVQEKVERRTKALIAAFAKSAEEIGISAKMHGGGSHFQWYFTAQEVVDYRTAATSDRVAYAAFVASLFEQSTLSLPNPLSHHAISLAHDDSVIEQLGGCFERGLRAAAGAVGENR